MSTPAGRAGAGERDDVVLRGRTDDDLAALVAWNPDPESVYLFAASSLQWPLTEEQLTALNAVESRTAWTIADASAPEHAIGQADLILNGERARISRVIVDPARRGERLGRTMMLLLLAKARELGATCADLNVIDGNEPALRTYRGLGFVDEFPPEYPGMVLMKVEL